MEDDAEGPPWDIVEGNARRNGEKEDFQLLFLLLRELEEFRDSSTSCRRIKGPAATTSQYHSEGLRRARTSGIGIKMGIDDLMTLRAAFRRPGDQ